MSTWVLIFWLSYSGSSAVSGFSFEGCQAAGKAYEKASGGNWICVEQK